MKIVNLNTIMVGKKKKSRSFPADTLAMEAK